MLGVLWPPHASNSAYYNKGKPKKLDLFEHW